MHGRNPFDWAEWIAYDWPFVALCSSVVVVMLALFVMPFVVGFGPAQAGGGATEQEILIEACAKGCVVLTAADWAEAERLLAAAAHCQRI